MVSFAQSAGERYRLEDAEPGGSHERAGFDVEDICERYEGSTRWIRTGAEWFKHAAGHYSFESADQ